MGKHIPALKYALSVCLNESQKHQVHYRQTLGMDVFVLTAKTPTDCLAQAKEVTLQISCEANTG